MFFGRELCMNQLPNKLHVHAKCKENQVDGAKYKPESQNTLQSNH